MKRIRPITSEDELNVARAEIDALISQNPKEGSAEADRLAVLAVLVEQYEQEHFPIEDPTPLDAIRFRMDQQNLSPRDLEPYLGSRSKVSEVLTGKKRLSLRMIRALHDGLGIPATILLKATHSPVFDWDKFPVREMRKRGWVDASLEKVRSDAGTVAREFFAQSGFSEVPVLFRRTLSRRGGATDEHALLAWLARVVSLAERQDIRERFQPAALTSAFLRRVAQLSRSENGPLHAQELLADVGIALVVERHLPRTRLDGASLVAPSGRGVVALTLRHDRLDSFWFTLLHELAHLAKHVSADSDIFVDDLDVPSNDVREDEADAIAREALIPRSKWKHSRARREQTAEAIAELAAELGVHSAIVAGRLRFEKKSFHVFSNLVGHRQVRVLFEVQ